MVRAWFFDITNQVEYTNFLLVLLKNEYLLLGELEDFTTLGRVYVVNPAVKFYESLDVDA